MSERIIVSGIYRSGTSLIAELIRLWGAYAGHEKDIFKDQYGYMEHFALQKLNDELLKKNSRVPIPASELIEKAQDAILRERALAALDEMDREAEQNGMIAWIWKDPRLPLVIPFWAQVWGDVIYVIPVRHPVETILSAAGMEGISPEDVPLSAGFIYWHFCMLNVLVFTEASHRKLFMAYDQLIRDPQQECSRLSSFLSKQCGLSPESDNGRIHVMASQVTGSQHHYHAPKSLAEVNTTTREQRALYNFLRVKIDYPSESFDQNDFALYPGWKEYLETMDRLLSFTSPAES